MLSGSGVQRPTLDLPVALEQGVAVAECLLGRRIRILVGVEMPKEAIRSRHDVLDLGARPCLEEWQRVDQHALVRNQFGRLLQTGQSRTCSDAAFENRLGLEVDCRRERRQVVERSIGFPLDCCHVYIIAFYRHVFTTCRWYRRDWLRVRAGGTANPHPEDEQRRDQATGRTLQWTGLRPCPAGIESRCLRGWEEKVIGNPRRVLQGLPDILLLEVGVLGDDLRRRHAVGDEVHDQRHRDPHAADACLATQDVGVKRDPVESEHEEPPLQVYAVSAESVRFHPTGCRTSGVFYRRDFRLLEEFGGHRMVQIPSD